MRRFFTFAALWVVLSAALAQAPKTDDSQVPTGALSGAAWRNDPDNQRRYWVIKDSFTRAAEQWNRENADKSPPFRAGMDVAHELRRAYVETLDKLWPSLTGDRYTAEKITEIKEYLSKKDAIELAVRAYLSELMTALAAIHPTDEPDEWKGPKSIFERMNKPTLGIRDAPNAVSLPLGHHFGRATITADSDRWTLELKGPKFDEKFEFEGKSFSFPLWTGKYEARAWVTGREPVQTTFEVTRGGNTQVPIVLPTKASDTKASPQDAKRPKQCFLEDEARGVEVRLAESERELGKDAVLRYDFRRFYASWRDGRIQLGNAPELSLADFERRLRERYRELPALDTLVPKRSRARFSDGTGQAPNPEFHDPCLNVRIDFSALEGDALHAGIDRSAFELDVAQAIVEWANARRADAPTKVDPITCFSVNDRFFVKAHVRWFAERKANPLISRDSPFVRLGDGSRGIVAHHYLQWTRERYDEACGRFPLVWKSPVGEPPLEFLPLAKSDDRTDLTIRFSTKAHTRSDDPGVIATAELGGEIEMHVNPKRTADGIRRWAFVPGRAWATYRKPKGLDYAVERIHFDRTVLHELGHFFGLRHLTRVNDNDFPGCIMWYQSEALSPVLTLPDVLAFNVVVNQSRARRGEVCDGLLFNPAETEK